MALFVAFFPPLSVAVEADATRAENTVECGPVDLRGLCDINPR